jgi:plasmid maintenance system killer protein
LEIAFRDKKLLGLYEFGSGTKLKLENRVVQSFFEVIAILEAAKDIYDLWKQPSLNFEKLQGEGNRYSARLGRKWRLEMSIEWQDEEMTVGVITIEAISNHYGG